MWFPFISYTWDPHTTSYPWAPTPTCDLKLSINGGTTHNILEIFLNILKENFRESLKYQLLGFPSPKLNGEQTQDLNEVVNNSFNLYKSM